MTNQVASQQTINIVPVQGIFGPEPTFTPITLVDCRIVLLSGNQPCSVRVNHYKFDN